MDSMWTSEGLSKESEINFFILNLGLDIVFSNCFVLVFGLDIVFDKLPYLESWP